MWLFAPTTTEIHVQTLTGVSQRKDTCVGAWLFVLFSLRLLSPGTSVQTHFLAQAETFVTHVDTSLHPVQMNTYSCPLESFRDLKFPRSQ